MKKVLSVVLAVAMLCTLCITAFAADTTITKGNGTPATANADIVTTYSASANDTYSIVIPAQYTIAWDDTTANALSYTVTTDLVPGSKIAVSAAADDNGDMTRTGGNEKLKFTLTDNTPVEYTGLNDAIAATTAPKATVASFDAPIDTYTGHVTFTVVYTPAN